MRKLIAALIITVTTTASAALLPDAKFRHLDTQNGLSNSQVNCVLRDKQGFVWIGTSYGLNRYDGYRFKTFYANQRDTTTMRDNFVSNIYEAYDGKLWIQLGMNYSIYDPVTEQFERNVNRVLSEFGIEGGVEKLYIDSRKCFWVKIYDNGIIYYNPYTKKRHHFRVGYAAQEILPDGICSFADLSGQLIYTTYNGDMICLNGEKGYVSWKNSWMRKHGGTPSTDYLIRVDKKGNIYVNNLNNTFIYLQKQKRWYKSLTQLMRSYGFEEVPDNLLVWDLLFDRKGIMWAATDHDGLFAIDLKNRQWRQFTHNKYDPSSISDNTPKNLYQDSEGQIWIGTYKNGANQYRAGSSYARSVELGDINSVVEDKYGNFWLGTNDRGIIVYNAATDTQLQQYTIANSNLSGNIMVGATYASDGSIWFGSYNGGLVRCIPTGNKAGGEATIVNYLSDGQPESLANNSVWSVIEDKWHRIWVGLLGGGIQMLDLKTGKFRTWDISNTKLPSNYITSARWTKKGWLMMGTSYYYCLVNPVNGKLINQLFPGYENLSNNTGNTVCVMEDSRGLVWQGSVSGLCIYDHTNQNLQTLDMTNGLFGSSVCSITEDLAHVMWVVTDHGVSRIIPEKQADGTWQFIIRSFNHRDGLQQGTYNQRSAYLTRDGRLLIGGQEGLDIITPKMIGANTSHEKPLFSGLQLYDQDVEVGRKTNGRIILKEALNKSKSLSLKSYESNFTIQLGSDLGIANNDKRFVYKLEGFRDTWSKTAENNPNITFMSLEPGSYTLRVRMLNDDGTMSDNESVLDIDISRPLWRTNTAIMFYLLLITILGIVWSRRIKRQHADRIKIEKLRRDTEKAQWMQRMQQQMQDQQREQQEVKQGEQQETAQPEQQEQTEQSETAEPSVTDYDTIHPVMDDIVGFIRNLCNQYVMPSDVSTRLSFLPLIEKQMLPFDPKLLGRALTILLDNSVKFSPSDGRIKVLIDCVAGQAEIRVADNGYGIPEEAKPFMFAPTIGEEGLGLYEVKQIVELHGGTIRASDNNPHGTVFFITIPVNS